MQSIQILWATDVALFFFFGLWIGSASSASNCTTVSTKRKFQCESATGKSYHGWNTLYWDSTNSGGIFRAVCCKPGSEAEATKLKTIDACQTSSCVTDSDPSSSSSLCPQRELGNGTLLTFEEVIRDNCVSPKGESGFVAQCCLRNSAEGLLLSMMGAELGEFPHQVGIQSCTRSSCGNCGGTIYNRNHVLTAAHCVVDGKTGQPKSPSQFTIQVGSNLGGHGGFDSEGSKYKVEAVLYHANYSKLRGASEFPKGDFGITYNDIALLRIKGAEGIRFSDNVKALELAPEGFVPERYAPTAVIAGWGTTDTLQTSPHLQKANVRIHSDQDCFGYDYERETVGVHRRRGSYQAQFLCVGGIYKGEFGVTAGHGDSGGPAICRGPDGYAVLCGITSFGSDNKNCSKFGTEEWCRPSVYAEVEYFRRNWELLRKEAGIQDPDTLFRYKLYGDEDLPADKVSHQVHITSDSSRPCGGTLIRKNVVLTAAHCIFQVDPRSGKKVAYHPGLQLTHGDRDLKNPNGTVLAIRRAVAHPGFERAGPPVSKEEQYNAERKFSRIMISDDYHRKDLAVVLLKEEVADVDEALLPKLPSPGSTPSGLASELSFPRDQRYGSRLRSREFRFVPQKSCQERLSRLSRLGVKSKLEEEDVACAVETYSGGSTCDRELGGGLICQGEGGEEEDKQVLCGIQIFRLCEFSIPNGFLNMGTYASWVKKAMAALSKSNKQ